MIYLDNAATSWPKPETVYQAVDHYMRNIGASPGRGSHGKARAAGYVLYNARETLAELLGILDPNRISFAYNATDALNTALLGTLQSGDTVITSAMEHNAVARPLRYLQSCGVQIKVAKCNANGCLDIDHLKSLIKEGAKAIVMTHASNVTGAIMPLAEVGQLAREHDALMIVDAAQTAGVEPIDTEAMGIDMLAFSGHKGLLGPQGTAGLFVRRGVAIKPLRYGGTGSLSENDVQPDFMPDMLESGTVNTPGIAGLAAGADFIRRTGLSRIREKEMFLSEKLVLGLEPVPGIKLFRPKGECRRTAVVSFTIEGQDSAIVSQRLDEEYGIISRGGLHCAPWAHQTIGTLATGTVRLSPGYFNTEEEIEQVIGVIGELAKEGGRV